MTSISISLSDERALQGIGTLLYYSAHVQMDYFWQYIIQRKATDSDHVPSQERIFPIKPKNKLLRMVYDEYSDSIFCRLEALNTC